MKKAADFASMFAFRLREYVALEQSSGKTFRVETSILKAFDRYLIERLSDQITEELVNDFTYSSIGLSVQQYHKRHRIVRRFSEYLCRMGESEAARPLPKLRKQGRHVPYVYTEDEILALMAAAKMLAPQSSLRPHTYHLLLGLLYSTGLRISEALNLDISDVDLETGVLRIRNTKFRKSRLVLVHGTTLDVLKVYAELRGKAFPERKTSAFLVNNRNSRLKYGTVNATFLQLLCDAGIREKHERGARIHDLRHTFAVRRVAAWYDSGEDIHEWLAVLATFMGHAHFEDTTYYLSASAELLEKGAVRFTRGGDCIE